MERARTENCWCCTSRSIHWYQAKDLIINQQLNQKINGGEPTCPGPGRDRGMQGCRARPKGGGPSKAVCRPASHMPASHCASSMESCNRSPWPGAGQCQAQASRRRRSRGETFQRPHERHGRHRYRHKHVHYSIYSPARAYDEIRRYGSMGVRTCHVTCRCACKRVM
jgi:hypothetical protein